MTQVDLSSESENQASAVLDPFDKHPNQTRFEFVDPNLIMTIDLPDSMLLPEFLMDEAACLRLPSGLPAAQIHSNCTNNSTMQLLAP